MSKVTEPVVENADIDRETPQPQIHVEERKLALNDFLKTSVKVNGSDLHLQAGSVPMIRVDGRARFLDCPATTDDQVIEFAKQLMPDVEREEILEKKGAVDVSYAMADGTARF